MVSQHPAKVSNREVVRVRIAATPPYFYLRCFSMLRNELYYQNRINLLSDRPRDNAKVIAKLRRKLRILEAQK